MVSKQRLKTLLDKRLAEMKRQYRESCYDCGMKGDKIKKTSATVARSKLKRDICILYLIWELLEQPTNSEVYGDEAMLAIAKLGLV